MRILSGETAEFDTATRIKMEYGNAFESVTGNALQHAHPGVQRNFPLWNEYWSGYADFVIGRHTDRPVIIEHKATGDKWFDYKQSLPRSAHLCQLWMYGRLYQEMYQVEPELILYYAAWGSYAEFRIREEGGMVVAEGEINGEPATRLRRISPDDLRREMEHYFKTRTVPPADNVDDWDYAETAYDRLSGAIWSD